VCTSHSCSSFRRTVSPAHRLLGDELPDVLFAHQPHVQLDQRLTLHLPDETVGLVLPPVGRDRGHVDLTAEQIGQLACEPRDGGSGRLPDEHEVDVARLQPRLSEVARGPGAEEKRALDTGYACERGSDDRGRAERLEQQRVELRVVDGVGVRPEEPLASDPIGTHQPRSLQPIGLAGEAARVEPQLACEFSERSRTVGREIDAREQLALPVGTEEGKQLGSAGTHDLDPCSMSERQR
jgi:hypothetical protein